MKGKSLDYEKNTVRMEIILTDYQLMEIINTVNNKGDSPVVDDFMALLEDIYHGDK